MDSPPPFDPFRCAVPLPECTATFLADLGLAHDVVEAITEWDGCRRDAEGEGGAWEKGNDDDEGGAGRRPLVTNGSSFRERSLGCMEE